jgi:hypothetical protein
VGRWPVEVWNEPNLDFYWQGASKENYFPLYEGSVLAIKSIDPAIRVGGPATCGISDDWVEDFLAFVRPRGLPLDFFSRHLYAGQPPRARTPELFYQGLSDPERPPSRSCARYARASTPRASPISSCTSPSSTLPAIRSARSMTRRSTRPISPGFYPRRETSSRRFRTGRAAIDLPRRLRPGRMEPGARGGDGGTPQAGRGPRSRGARGRALERNEATLVEISPFADESPSHLGLDDSLIDGY